MAGDISRMIDEFPDPDSLLSRDDNLPGLARYAGGMAGRGHGTASSSGIDSSDCDEAATSTSGIDPVAAATMLDVSASLERIRSKFKLLCTLLKTEQSFDLRMVLESGNGAGGGRMADWINDEG